MPKLGQTVLFKQPDDEAPRNGQTEHAAIVTKVHSDVEADLMVMFSGQQMPSPRYYVMKAPATQNGQWSDA